MNPSCADCQQSTFLINSTTSRNLSVNCAKNRSRACVACRKLASIERRIEDARRALDRLFKERNELASTINEHHDPFVHRLPGEVVSRILVLCRHFDPSTYISNKRHETKAFNRSIQTLISVCQHWRQVAQATPQLWDIFCATLTGNNCISSLSITSQWLQQSGQLPLFIQLDIGPEMTSSRYSRILTKALTPIALHAERCEVLDLDFSSKESTSIWVSSAFSGRHMDRLDHLKLASGSMLSTFSPDVAPRRLTLHTPGSNRFLSRTNYVNLTHIFAQVMSNSDATHLFGHAPHLSVCIIRQIDQDDGSQRIPLDCPALRSLTIGPSSPTFWNGYTFPSLSILRIVNPGHARDNQCWKDFVNFLRRSDCELQELTLKYRTFCKCWRDVVGVVWCTPSLKELVVEGALLHQHLFLNMGEAEEVTAGNADQPSLLLSQLRSLSCSTDDPNFNWSSIILFLMTMTSRQSPTIESFTFQYKGSTRDDLLKWMMTKDEMKDLMDAVHGVKLQLVNCEGQDMLEELRCLHDL